MNLPGPENPSQLYVVHTDRAGLHRVHGVILAVHGVLALILAALIIAIGNLGVGWYSVLPFLILLLGQAFQLSIHSFSYGARLSISQPLTLTAWGFAMNTAGGRLEVPWEAVTGVGIRNVRFNRVLMLQLHPNAGPGSTGVDTDLSEGYWKRIRRFGGVMLGRKGIHQDLNEIVQAVHHFSNGRVPVLPG
jgi:hypothetical protein